MPTLKGQRVIVVTATCYRIDPSTNCGAQYDYFGEGGRDLLFALEPSERWTEEAIKAEILRRLNAYLTECGHGPEHHFGPEHMGYEHDLHAGHVDWQYQLSEVC